MGRYWLFKKNKNLQNIFNAAILHFKNESNYYIGIQKYQNESTKSDLRKLVLRKQVKIKQISDIIIHLLDNYWIRNCEVIKVRFIVNQENENNSYDKIQPTQTIQTLKITYRHY